MLLLDLLDLTRTTLSVLAVGFAVVSSLAFFLYLSGRPTLPPDAPKLTTSTLPVIGAFEFFRAPYSFFLRSIAESKNGFFSFYLGPHPVIGVSGAHGKVAFFESSQLNLADGYNMLFGGGPAPNPEKEDPNAAKGFPVLFSKRLIARMRTENFVRELPRLIHDVRGNLDSLCEFPTGIMDPFDKIYKTIFLTTMRMVGCHEVVNDPVLLAKVLGYYEMIEKSSTPATVIAPWLPTPALIRRSYAGLRLYLIMNKIVDDRKRLGIREDDCMQLLLDNGDGVPNVVAFIVGVLYAALLNSGINACYVISHLATNPKWTALLREEINTAANKYGPAGIATVDKLAHIPLSAWETQFPLNDMCLKESIRLQAVGAGFRRNVTGRDVVLNGGEVIPPGAFVAWHFYDSHYDPEVWTDRAKWDPERYLPHRAEDKKKPYAWIGWGAGRHPCQGMRFAKMEQNILTAHFLTMFDYNLCDEKGQAISELPPTDIEGHAAKKPTPGITLRYRIREKS